MLSIAFLSSLLFSGFCFGKEFDYEGSDGPSQWGKKFPQCIGQHQSPINIEEHIKNVHLPLLKLDGIDSPYNLIMTNDGHTVLLKLHKFKRIALSGGPLRDIYLFDQLHFHWGKNDYKGSEHLIHNHSFSMEMHAVFYKEDYKSKDKALDHDDGLTVLGYLYKAGRHQNAVFKPIVAALPDIQQAGKEITLRRSLLLKKLLVPNIVTMQDYFTYNGSLTTPPCLEIVTWIVFKDHQHLSHKQLAAFRNVENKKGNKLTHNFRPPQPLKDRVVCQNIPIKPPPDACLYKVYFG